MTDFNCILDTLPDFPQWRDLRLEDRDLYRAWIARHHIRQSELVFTNLYVWRFAMPVRVARYGDFLVVLRLHEDGPPTLFAPIGDGDLESASDMLLDWLAEEYPERTPALERVSETDTARLSERGFLAAEDRDSFDYIYSIEDLAQLSGRRHDGKRNHIRRCLEQNPCEYVVVGPGCLEDSFDLATEWCNVRHCDINPPLAAEFRAIRQAFEQFVNLGLISGGIRINGIIEAFAIAEGIDNETAVVHFEKANPNIEGLYQVINQWFCQNALASFKWVNREQDLGLEGLRRAKMSYVPERFEKKFTVTRK